MARKLKPNPPLLYVKHMARNWNGMVEQTSKRNHDVRYLQIATILFFKKRKEQNVLVEFRSLPHSYSLWIVYYDVGLGVEVGEEEGEDDVHSEEAIDDVVHYKESVLLVGQECELERRNPG